MRVASDWKDYELIDCSAGEKLERWTREILIRPDPQVIWNSPRENRLWAQPGARYVRSRTGGGKWQTFKRIPAVWQVRYKDLTFNIKTMGFKHTGLFPEQAVNWDLVRGMIEGADRPVKVLNLFAYTGGATLAQVLISVAFLLLTALAALSVGLVCSSLFQRTVTSTVVSYLSVFALGLVTLLPLWYDVKRIGDLYDAMNIVGQQLHMIEYTPVSFTLNPGLGLFSLLASQTQMFSSILWQFSYSLANTYSYLPFEHFLYCNMAFLAAASVLLTALAALNLRVRRPRAPKGSKRA